MKIKNKKNIIIVLLALLLSFSIPLIAFAENKTYNVAVIPFTPPYQFIQDNKLVGAHIEILNEIGANLNIDFNFITYDNETEAIKALKNNEVSLILGISLTKRNKNNLLYSASISQDYICIMTHKSNPSIINDQLNTYSYSASAEKDIADINEIRSIISLPCWILPTTQEAYNEFKSRNLDILIGPALHLKN